MHCGNAAGQEFGFCEGEEAVVESIAASIGVSTGEPGREAGSDKERQN